MNGFDALVEFLPQSVDIDFLSGRDKDTVVSQFGHPGFLEVLQGDILSFDGREVIIFFGGIGEGVYLVEDNNTLDVFDHFFLLLKI